jgi:hypothetical protein
MSKNEKSRSINIVSFCILGIVLLGGCQSSAIPEGDKVADRDSLKISMEAGERTRDSLNVKLIFENVSPKLLRIYYIDDPLFSRTQNSFYLIDKQGKRHFELEDGPPPHGYVVSEKDFYLIEAESKKQFNVKVALPVKDPAALEWVYRNQITSWRGGIETLDGKTKVLFEGREIPYIWRGRIETRIKLK